ncbi:MAG: hypothetical protein U0003_05240 [Vampirovibrionales bacterium]
MSAAPALPDKKKPKMKLSLQFALTCSSGALVLVGLTTLMVGLNTHDALSVYHQMSTVDRLTSLSLYKPLKIITWGFPAALLGGFLGYVMGDILDNPRGKIPEYRLKKKNAQEKEANEAANTPVFTGEETFLDDLDSLFDDLPAPAPLDI